MLHVLPSGIQDCRFDKDPLLAEYWAFAYERYGTYEQAARIVKRDRGTAKKYVQIGLNSQKG